MLLWSSMVVRLRCIDDCRQQEHRQARLDIGPSAWELVCQVSATIVFAGQPPSIVARKCPLHTAFYSPIGHATGTAPSPYHLEACGPLEVVSADQLPIRVSPVRCRPMWLLHLLLHWAWLCLSAPEAAVRPARSLASVASQQQ